MNEDSERIVITCYWLVTVERRNWCEEFQPPWKEWREFCLLWIYELLWTCWLILVVRYRKEYDEIKRCEWMNRIYMRREEKGNEECKWGGDYYSGVMHWMGLVYLRLWLFFRDRISQNS
jgi:hypothetical protein